MQVIPADFGPVLNEGMRRGWLANGGLKSKCVPRPTDSDRCPGVCTVCFDKGPGELEFTSIAKVVQELGALCLVVINNCTRDCDDLIAGHYRYLTMSICLPISRP